MHQEVCEVDDFLLPTENHRLALQAIVEDFSDLPFGVTLLVAGSVSRGEAQERSDIDMLCVADSSEAAAVLATGLLGRPNAVSAQHGIVSVSMHRHEVKVSLRIMDMGFLHEVFIPKHHPRRSIWKTHKISSNTKRPELIVTASGGSELRPFHELHDSNSNGWVYQLSLSDAGGPLLNVEMTMLLESRIVAINSLGITPSEMVADGLRSHLNSHGKLDCLNRLVAAGYLGAASASDVESYLGSS